MVKYLVTGDICCTILAVAGYEAKSATIGGDQLLRVYRTEGAIHSCYYTDRQVSFLRNVIFERWHSGLRLLDIGEGGAYYFNQLSDRYDDPCEAFYDAARGRITIPE